MAEPVGPPPAPESRVPESPRQCPQCGAAFGDASALTDHVLTAHGTAGSPASYLRPVRHRTFLRALGALACLLGVALVVLVIIGALSTKDDAEETPSSVVHQMAVQLKQDGEIDEYRAVEPNDGWDTEYELDGDALIRIRGEGTPTEHLEYEAFSGDLREAIEDEARARGFLLQD